MRHYYALILLFALKSSISFSQDSLLKFVDSSINDIKLKSNLPTMLYGPVRYPTMIFSAKLNENEEDALINECYYFIYKENNKSFITKFINADGRFSSGNYKSKPLEISNDSIIHWIKANFYQLKNEKIYPYIYVDTLNNVPVYANEYRMHSFPFYANIYFNNKNAYLTFEEIDMMESSILGESNFHKNLNYKSNIQTHTYIFYSKLNEIVKLYFDKFKFD